MIELRGIERDFLVGDETVHALRAVDLVLPDGDYVSVMGPSGSGKSTLLNVLGLLDRPNAGSYRLDDTETTDLPEERRAVMRRERVGFVFQTFHLIPRLSAADNIGLPMLLAGIESARRQRRINEVLSRARPDTSRQASPPPTVRRTAPARRHRPCHRDASAVAVGR